MAAEKWATSATGQRKEGGIHSFSPRIFLSIYCRLDSHSAKYSGYISKQNKDSNSYGPYISEAADRE